MLTVGSVFSCIGGLDLGLERAGMKVAWQCEVDPFRRRVLAKNFPGIPIYSDIREVKGREVSPIDVLAGGFPCKNTSTAAAIHGSRQGLAGAESGLWFEQLRLADELRPTWVVVENVSGAEAWRPAITEGLEGLGYTVSVLPVSAADVGAPHLRRRMFFVAHAHGARLEVPWAAGPSPAHERERRAAARDTWLATIPGVRGMDDGLPSGVDRSQRIDALGNVVVPAQGQLIGRLIMASHLN